MLISGLCEIDPKSHGVSAARIIELTKNPPVGMSEFPAMRAALAEIGGRHEGLPTPQKLGLRLQKLKERVHSGKQIVCAPDSHSKINHWRVVCMADSAGDAGSCGDSFQSLHEKKVIQFEGSENRNGEIGTREEINPRKPPHSPQDLEDRPIRRVQI
jgi:hypothetical protein